MSLPGESRKKHSINIKLGYNYKLIYIPSMVGDYNTHLLCLLTNMFTSYCLLLTVIGSITINVSYMIFRLLEWLYEVLKFGKE